MKTTTIAIVMSACAGMCTSTAWAQSTRPPLVGGYVSAGAGLARPPSGNPTSVATETDGVNTDQATTTFELPGARTFEVEIGRASRREGEETLEVDGAADE